MRGALHNRTEVLTWKMYDNIPGNDKFYYSDAGSEVRWGGKTNEGYEEFYGGRLLRWCEVWNDELQAWFSVGLEEREVDWDDESDQVLIVD